MYGKLSNYARNMCKNSNGSVQGSPRITNKSKANRAIVGYAEVNTMATTAFSRTKVHKGYFYCAKTDVANGDVILDRDDDVYYFIMSVKSERGASDESVYIDGTLYKCDSRIEISRFGVDDTRDTFGRVIAAGAAAVVQDPAKVVCPGNVITSVFAMNIPKNFDVIMQQDREIAQNKISLCMQAGTNVAVADRIVDLDTNQAYRVTNIDYKSLAGLLLVYVDGDER